MDAVPLQGGDFMPHRDTGVPLANLVVLCG
jgi:hypothetical protein